MPGIGKRTAERIIVELREKVAGAVADEIVVTRATDDPRTLAREGLVGLGFDPREADSAARPGQGRDHRGAHRRRPEGGPVSDGGIRTPGVERIQTPEPLPAEDELDRSLRPRRLDDFVGQDSVREQLGVFIEAAKARGEALDHVLLAGPPGLGKTSLAQIVAAELGADFVSTAGPALERKGDVASYLSSLEPRSVFFVDEIHRLPRALEETFYPAMEDRRLPITVGQGAGARVVNLDLPPFTLIGATTRAGLLTTPLRDRFGVSHRLELYDPDELGSIVRRSAGILEVDIDDDGAGAIAARSRGTPRVANRLLKRVRDFAEVRGAGHHRRHGGRRGPGHAPGRPPGPRPPGPRDPGHHQPQVQRRPGRPLDPGGGRGRGAGHRRGRLRALPAPAGADHAHPARAGGDPGGLRAPGAGGA